MEKDEIVREISKVGQQIQNGKDEIVSIDERISSLKLKSNRQLVHGLYALLHELAFCIPYEHYELACEFLELMEGNDPDVYAKLVDMDNPLGVPYGSTSERSFWIDLFKRYSFRPAMSFGEFLRVVVDDGRTEGNFFLKGKE